MVLSLPPLFFCRFTEKGNLEVLLFTIQSKMRANNQKVYMPREGKLISDINKVTVQTPHPPPQYQWLTFRHTKWNPSWKEREVTKSGMAIMAYIYKWWGLNGARSEVEGWVEATHWVTIVVQQLSIKYNSGPCQKDLAQPTRLNRQQE